MPTVIACARHPLLAALYDQYMPLWHPRAFAFRFHKLRDLNMMRVARMAKHGYKYFRYQARKPQAAASVRAAIS